MPLPLLRVKIKDTLLLQTLTQNNLCCNVRQCPASAFRQERNRPRRTRVYLNNIDVIVAINKKLDVVQSYDCKIIPFTLSEMEKEGYTLIESPL